MKAESFGFKSQSYTSFIEDVLTIRRVLDVEVY